ncbi:hypothetical protein JX265_005851 [Neoarthrinium moseri]|uniref:NACHT-NTPase and P-loop NTPases N-terminal domain-containing protein n=1 Tax=Neoarthrinium moseri TaxID=1658444 RepID=A0A9P9WNC2_9PEZI|nr:hypothetical protein JX265_005851 [Neoarthrinium moseri]
MAEVLSIFASGVAVAQVAGKAGGAVIKLKKLWDEVKDVPETIQCLMDQIDCLDPALWEAEQHIAQNELPAMLWNDSAAVRSAEYCRKALSKLTELVDDLAVQISSSRGLSKRLAKVKVVLKKDELGKLERRLETAVRLLQTAQQGNIIAMLKLQPDIIVGRVVAKIDNIASSSNQLLKGPERQFEEQDNVDHARCTLKQTYSTEVIHRRKQNNLQTAPWRKPGVLGGFVYERSSNLLDAGFRPPNWLSGISYAWDINLRKSYDGWNFHFRSYSIRPRNSDVFQFARNGNLEVLKGMFASGEASPFDCDEDGYDVTYHAAMFYELRIVKFFMDLNIINESKTYRGGSTRSNMDSRILASLRHWLGAAKAAGIDLAKFGRRENELLQGAVRGHRGPQHVRGNTSIKVKFKCYSNRVYIGDSPWQFKSKILGFKIGPEIEDWDILITEPTDRFAGHFWKMVEPPPPTSLEIPGAWVDEPENYDSSNWTSSEDEEDNTERDLSDDGD